MDFEIIFNELRNMVPNLETILFFRKVYFRALFESCAYSPILYQTHYSFREPVSHSWKTFETTNRNILTTFVSEMEDENENSHFWICYYIPALYNI